MRFARNQVVEMGSESPKKVLPAVAMTSADHWITRLVRSARAGAPAVRALLTAKVELKVTIGSTRESAQGASIVSEWLAGRFAVAPHFEVLAFTGNGARVSGQLHLDDDPGCPAAWQIEALLGADGLAREITVRIEGSA